MASSIICKNCGKEFTGSICPYCNSKYSRHSKGFYAMLGFFAVLIPVLIYFFAVMPMPSSKNITKQEYQQIQVGMKYAEVVEIVGGKGEFIYDENIFGNRYTTVRWKQTFNMYGLADVYFINGIVDSKNEVGIR